MIKGRLLATAAVSVLVGLAWLMVLPAWGEGVKVPFSGIETEPTDSALDPDFVRIKPGSFSPDFLFRTVDGVEGSLYTTAQKKPVLLNFWATWCGPCQHEIPFLVELYQKHRDKFELLALAGWNSPLEDIEKTRREKQMGFPILLDKDGNIFDLYQIQGVPTTLLIAPGGKILRYQLGSFDSYEELEEFLLGALGEGESKPSSAKGGKG